MNPAEHPDYLLNSFDQVNDNSETLLSKPLLRGIYSTGFVNPTTVQQLAILGMTRGHDAIIQAQSGTGKTGAFCIGSLSRIDLTQPEVQVLVLCPTVSLARQTGQVYRDIGRYLFPDSSNNKTGELSPDWLLVSYGGGTPFEQEIRLLQSGKVRVVVGTSGRVSHLMRERVFGRFLKIVIFDEADVFLEDNFVTEICSILEKVPQSVQVCLFSATMSIPILNNARKLVRKDPPCVEVLLDCGQVTLDGITQHKIVIPESTTDSDQIKFAVISELYQHYSVARCVIFTNSRKRAEWLGQGLKSNGYSVAILHGDLSKEDRISVETSFREGVNRILVSSDLLSRGFDVQDLSLVINFD